MISHGLNLQYSPEVDVLNACSQLVMLFEQTVKPLGGGAWRVLVSHQE